MWIESSIQILYTLPSPCILARGVYSALRSFRQNPSVRLGPQGEEAVRHGLQMPHCWLALREGLAPFAAKLGRDAPPHIVISESHSHQVPLLGRILTVDEAFSAVQYRQVVDEVDIARLGTHLQLGRPADGLDGI